MRAFLRFSALLTISLASLVACRRAADEVAPAATGPLSVRGEWRLAASGGGITGIMTPAAADYDARIVLGPDSAYAEYTNGKLVRTSTFQVRTRASQAGGPAEQLLVIKTDNTPTGQPLYYPYYITLLTTDKLHFTTGSGCALNAEYVRTKAASPAPTAP